MANQLLGCARCVAWFSEAGAAYGYSLSNRYTLRADKANEDGRFFSSYTPRLLELAADGWTVHTDTGSWLPMLAVTQVGGTLLCGVHAYAHLGPTPQPPLPRRP